MHGVAVPTREPEQVREPEHAALILPVVHAHAVLAGVSGVVAVIRGGGGPAGAWAARAPRGAAAAALICAGAVSRGAVPAVMARLAPARRDGLAAAAGRLPSETALAATGIAALVAVVALGPPAGLVAVLVGGGAAAAVMGLARRQLGGHTGDVLGAVQQAAETAVLLAAAAAV